MDNPVLLIMLGFVAALIAGGVLFLRRRRTGDDSFHHFRCPACQRRLRFRERQIGHKGMCSNCGREVIFPPLTKAID